MLVLKQIAREARDAVGTYSDSPVRDFDVSEDIGLWILVQLALRCLVRVRRESFDVALFVNNALDSRPELLRYGFGGPGSGYGGQASPVFATTFRPRTVGLSASWHF